jgi:hypothetical protein
MDRLTKQDWENILSFIDISINSLGDLEYEEQQELRQIWLPTVIRLQSLREEYNARNSGGFLSTPEASI